jgi:hypothetical protein
MDYQRVAYMKAVIPKVPWTHTGKLLVFMALTLTVSGCGVISNLDSMRASMDQMAYFTGIMASNMPVMAESTRRMSITADRMDRKTTEISQSLEKRGVSIEKNIYGVSQDTLSQNRKMIGELTGIRAELGEITKSLTKYQEKGASPDPAKINALQGKLNELETKLTNLSVKIGQQGRQPSP